MARTSFLLPFLGVLFLLSGCEKESTQPGDDSRALLQSLSASERQTLSSGNAFGFRLFAVLAAGDEGNIILSPLSVSMALTMTYNGARNSTEQAMARTLGFEGMDRTAINALYAKLIPALKSADGNVTFKVANAIWSAPRLVPAADFTALNRETFGAQAGTLDFTADSAVPFINKWVSDHTQGLIGQLVDPPLPADLVMLLVNALYFKGNWSRPFNPDLTYNGTFHLAGGGTRTCRMMQADTTFRYLEDGKALGLELPYGDSLFSMVLLQPAEGTSLDEIVQAAGEEWEIWLEKFKPASGPIHVPKFKLEYGKSLEDALKALGMEVAFDDRADFTGINAGGGLMISEVKHKTLVNVDETGTEAAAVTSVGIVDTAAPADLIRFDRPFLFAIRERTSGAILFLGRIMDPGP